MWLGAAPGADTNPVPPADGPALIGEAVGDVVPAAGEEPLPVVPVTDGSAAPPPATDPFAGLFGSSAPPVADEVPPPVDPATDVVGSDVPGNPPVAPEPAPVPAPRIEFFDLSLASVPAAPPAAPVSGPAAPPAPATAPTNATDLSGQELLALLSDDPNLALREKRADLESKLADAKRGRALARTSTLEDMWEREIAGLKAELVVVERNLLLSGGNGAPSDQLKVVLKDRSAARNPSPFAPGSGRNAFRAELKEFAETPVGQFTMGALVGFYGTPLALADAAAHPVRTYGSIRDFFNDPFDSELGKRLHEANKITPSNVGNQVGGIASFGVAGAGASQGLTVLLRCGPAKVTQGGFGAKAYRRDPARGAYLERLADFDARLVRDPKVVSQPTIWGER